MTGTTAGPHVLILVQNLTVPFDRRVWQEARTLAQSGYEVSVISPRSEQHPARYELLEGVHLYRYSSLMESRNLWSYPIEYGVALAAHVRLAGRAHRRRKLDVIQACNPPDLLFLVALPFVALFRSRFVFDHHDVSPELLVAKGHDRRSAVVRLALMLERWTFRLARVSIATNDSYRRIAIERGGMHPEDVFVVRSGADLSRFHDAHPDERMRRGKQHLVAYVGVMGIQEGIDYLLDAARIIVVDAGRQDIQFSLAGSGPELARLSRRAVDLGLQDHVTFLGRVSDEDLTALLTTADVCVNPDEHNEMNDMSTMNKIMDYMAVSKPIVQFDLHEGRVSAGEASSYAAANEPAALARAIVELLDDPARRQAMGRAGRRRLEDGLTWEHQVPALLAAYERVLGERAARREVPPRAHRPAQ